jgi:hypothetical protein
VRVIRVRVGAIESSSVLTCEIPDRHLIEDVSPSHPDSMDAAKIDDSVYRTRRTAAAVAQARRAVKRCGCQSSRWEEKMDVAGSGS